MVIDETKFFKALNDFSDLLRLAAGNLSNVIKKHFGITHRTVT